MELIGRQRELDALVDRLSGHRLVTVIGTGGIGKTALARAAVDRVRDGYELGAHVIDLTRVDTPEAVGGAMAAQLGFPSFSALLNSPTEQPALLLVDNCEHVIDAAADAVARLLEACLSPTVLATSRSPLDLPGETLVVLGPLPLPAAGLVDADVPSVRLFRERAADVGVDIGSEQLDAVAELCRALDGLPLALEIAAARARVMTPAEMMARLDLDTLTRPRFRGSRRHRSLRATIAWSYDLLGPADRRLFDRLGVLAGQFDADTAHAVGGDAGLSPADTLDRIDALVGASLLVAEQTGETTHYRQLGTLRSFALERLGEAGELQATWDRFVAHVVDAALRVSVAGRDGWNASVLSHLLTLSDNLLAALRWCLEHDDEPSRCLQLQAVLWGVVHQGHAEDVAPLVERVLTRWPDPTAPGWADAVATTVTCRYLLGEARDAIALAEGALAHADRSLLAPCTLRRVIGEGRAALGDLAGARASFEAAGAEARRRDVLPFALEMDVFGAQLRADLGDLDGALDALAAVQREAAHVGSDLNELWARSVTGHLLLRRDIGRAQVVIGEALELARQLDHPACVAVNRQSSALAQLATGQTRAAAGTVVHLTEELVMRGAVEELRTVLQIAALVLYRAGRTAWVDLAASASSMPVVSLLARPGHELIALPERPGRVLSRRDAIVAIRHELGAVAADPATDAAAADSGTDRAAADPGTAAGHRGAAARRAAAALAIDDLRPGGQSGGARFVPVGDFWEVAFGGRTVNLKDSKGLADLARLLTNPNAEVHCLDLAGVAAEQPSTGELIDPTARRRYEERIRDLQCEIDDAEANHDHARVEKYQSELDTIVEHLAAALGLGGKARRGGDTAERARQAVTQRIRATIRRINAVHPELGRHLEAAVATGIYCTYRPEHPVRWHR